MIAHQPAYVCCHTSPWVGVGHLYSYCDTVHVPACRWVPVLFGLAAVILGTGHTVLDRVAGTWKVCIYVT